MKKSKLNMFVIGISLIGFLSSSASYGSSFRELEDLENELGEFRVYVVEICQRCRWNHLHTSYLLGDGRKRKPPRRVRTLEDEDFSR